MTTYARNRLKDSLVIVVWILALIPILPLCLIIMLSEFLEKVTDWYEGLVLAPIRNWRNKWNPMKLTAPKQGNVNTGENNENS